MPLPPPRRTAVAVATALLVLGGCGEDEAGTPAPATTAGTATSSGTAAPSATGTAAPATSEPASDEEAVLAAVDCYWATIVEANDPPDPDHPGFARCFTGDALERSRGNVEERRLLGQRVDDPTGIEPLEISITSLSDASAIVAACFVDDAVLIDVPSDQVLNDSVATVSVEILVSRDGATWRVAESSIVQSVPDHEPCDS